MQIKVTPEYDLYKTIKDLKHSTESDISVFFSKKSNVYLNASNLLIIKQVGSQFGKKITFEVENPLHQDFINSVNNDQIEFLNPEFDLSDMTDLKSHKSFNPFKTAKNIFAKVPVLNKLAGKVDEAYSADMVKVGEKGLNKFLKTFLIFGLVASLVVGLFYAALWFVPSANVKLKIKSDILIKLLDVVASKNSQISVENKTIPVIELSVSETDSQTLKTSGKRIDGEKAEGKVLIYNKTDSDKKIKKNTVLKLVSTDNENIKYVTQSEVTVPQKTTTVEGTTSTDVFGKKEVEITALDIGEKYNQDNGEKFEVDDYDTDDLVAENESKITGGKQEEKKVVSQTDIDVLKAGLETVLKQKIVDSIKRKTISSQSLIESAVTYEIKSATFDKKLDEEAEELTLTTTMSGTGLAYSTEDLDMVVKELAKSAVPEQFSLDQENLDYDIAATQDTLDKTKINIQVKLRSYVFPKVDTEKIKADLSGRSLASAKEYMDDMKNVEAYNIEIIPRLPGPLLRLPVRTSNITVIIEK